MASAQSPVIHFRELKSLTKRSRVTLWRWIKSGRFPQPCQRWPGKGHVWDRATVMKFLGVEN